MRMKGDLRLVSGVLATPSLMVKGIDSSVKSVRGGFSVFWARPKADPTLRTIDARSMPTMAPSLSRRSPLPFKVFLI